MKWVKSIAATTLVASLLATPGFAAHAAETTPTTSKDGFKLTVLHSNDTHSHPEEATKRATKVKELRAANKNSLLLDAGDVFSGTLYFNEFAGEADMKLMNLMGYDAMTFGNHEFDLGSRPEGHAALAKFVKGAEFPLLGSNLDFSKESLFEGLQFKTVTKDFENGKIYDGIIKEIDGEQVGIFSLTTEETPSISSVANVQFANYIDSAKKAVAELEKQGVNKIIALTHIGFNDSKEWDNDLLLAQAVEGIDVIVGGHSHTKLDKPVKAETSFKDPTIVVQTGQYSENLGELDLTFDDNGAIVDYIGQLHPLKSVEADAEAEAILAPYKEQVSKIKNQSIGSTAVSRLNGDRGLWGVRAGETNLGNLITDGMLAGAKKIDPEVQFAFQNGGGIRSSIDAGDITMGEVLEVMSFGNALGIVKVTGAEIYDIVEQSVKEFPKEAGGFLHFSGLQVEFDGKAPAGKRVKSIKLNGKELDKAAYYKGATNTFVAQGQDGYDTLKKVYEDGRVSEPGTIDYEMFIDHLVTLKKVDAKVEGRIIATIPFTDITKGSETEGYVRDLYYRDLTKGTTATTYSPNANLTRAQAASFIARALKLEAKGQATFSDIANVNPATQKEITALAEAGIVKGVNGKFNPNTKVTRAQLALMFARAYNLQNDEKTGLKADFSDISKYNAETQNAIALMKDLKIVSGVNGKFMPGNNATRAHMAKMLSNYIPFVKESK
ncbi:MULTISPECIES: 5'-nucleotidase C-terminal domain-containing protein [unclassified Lysinibacillus]|uniref:5'-nucleotidase C-terminal domain-containing protein n=1 Tax=unclassified Lysinibacillus TaxID=2636778 RepID=UPI002013B7F0|nr:MULTISPECIES: 5'-nucleotidase C-terminal domain-containing protein [unclassified Lysinibacillus]MCL1698514.1 5'-nucleotidase C-terminal domain-containing protein [Lysinibacillus sp. BPa_S21]MCL1703176.1 5'-nucleotidase C-terminal domain-containing protein [Lysinibacillus sp. Bpr_S20]